MKTHGQWKSMIDDLIFGRMSESAFISAIQSDARAEETERANRAEAELETAKAMIQVMQSWDATKMKQQIEILESGKWAQTSMLIETQDKLAKAEAACAEMRECLYELTGKACEFIGPDEDNKPECVCCGMSLDTVSKGHKMDCLANAIMECSHALSTDCGKGWLSPEKRKELEQQRDNFKSQRDSADVEIVRLRTHIKTLVEALTRLFRAAQYVCAHRYEDDTPAGTRIAAVLDLKAASDNADCILARVKGQA